MAKIIWKGNPVRILGTATRSNSQRTAHNNTSAPQESRLSQAHRYYSPSRPSKPHQVGTQTPHPRPRRTSRSKAWHMPDNSLNIVQSMLPAPRWLQRVGISAWLSIGIIALIAASVYFVGQIYLVFISLFIAFLLTAILLPLTNLLNRIMPRALATAVSLLGSFSLVIGMVIYVVSSIASQWHSLAGQFGNGMSQIFKYFREIKLPFQNTQDNVYNLMQELLDKLMAYLRQNSGTLAQNILANATSLAVAVTVALLAIFISVFFLYSGGNMWQWCESIAFPLPRVLGPGG